jgi:hypothetical protein
MVARCLRCHGSFMLLSTNLAEPRAGVRSLIREVDSGVSLSPQPAFGSACPRSLGARGYSLPLFARRGRELYIHDRPGAARPACARRPLPPRSRRFDRWLRAAAHRSRAGSTTHEDPDMTLVAPPARLLPTPASVGRPDRMGSARSWRPALEGSPSDCSLPSLLWRHCLSALLAGGAAAFGRVHCADGGAIGSWADCDCDRGSDHDLCCVARVDIGRQSVGRRSGRLASIAQLASQLRSSRLTAAQLKRAARPTLRYWGCSLLDPADIGGVVTMFVPRVTLPLMGRAENILANGIQRSPAAGTLSGAWRSSLIARLAHRPGDAAAPLAPRGAAPAMPGLVSLAMLRGAVASWRLDTGTRTLSCEVPV